MRTQLLPLLAIASLDLAAAQVPSVGNVVVLATAPAPGVDATSVDAALALAGDGDTILVRDGTYPSASGILFVTGRSVAIVADEGASPVILGLLFVQGLSASDAVTVRGIELRYTGSEPAVEIWYCDGLVWIEDCTLRGSALTGGHLRVLDSRNVVVLRSTLGPETLPGTGELGTGPGIALLSGALHLYGCDVRGTNGAGSAAGIGPGAPAVYAYAGYLYASGCTLTGGTGATGQPVIPFGCAGPSDGGPALVLGLGAPLVELLDTALLGGAPGELGCSSTPAQFGSATDSAAGTVVVHAGVARSFHLGSPVRSGQSTTVQLDGLPDDLVGVFAAAQPAAIPLSVFHGTLLVDPSAVLVLATVLGPSGSATFAVPDPLSAPAGGQTRIWLQGFFVGTHGIGFLGGASELTTLDPSL